MVGMCEMAVTLSASKRNWDCLLIKWSTYVLPVFLMTMAESPFNICIFTTKYQMMNIAEIKDMVRSASGITEFQRRVYLALLDVPKGSIITYGELALKVGCKSPRAIGNALHKNPFAPLVPCHRVIRANGEIGGYAFGQQEKLRLLREEGAI